LKVTSIVKQNYSPKWTCILKRREYSIEKTNYRSLSLIFSITNGEFGVTYLSLHTYVIKQ